MPKRRETRAFRVSERTSGLLLHPTSLPGPHGCGDLGPAAHRFVDFLAAGGQRWWQMLPVNPPGPGNSPYSALSAFAGSPWLISLDRLREDGLLSRSDLRAPADLGTGRVRYPSMTRFRLEVLERAFQAFAGGGGLRNRDFTRFCGRQRDWLEDFATFMALRCSMPRAEWTTWPLEIRRRQPRALQAATRTNSLRIAFQCFVQYEFSRQWAALRQYAHARGVGLIGDIPIFVAGDSSDVWANPELFDLEADGRPRTISGVPPDMFSRTGQLWGHPQYRWPRHRRTGFAWWIARFARIFSQFDAVRIDHFLGFYRVWSVPGRDRTALRGEWIRVPGRQLFSTLQQQLGRLEIIAEDLGVIVPAALALRDRFGFPGMRILQCGFGGDGGAHYNEPHTFPRNCVVYPGTHDNDTIVGWFQALRASASTTRRRSEKQRDAAHRLRRLLRYTGTDGRQIHWDLIRLALLSPANLAIIPVPDLLGLDNSARMNLPATGRGNWEWRLEPGQLTTRVAARMRELAEAYGRC